jgi:predicted restriction endonuclease
VNNGLLLIPNLDVLFDKGYITFNENGLIHYSKKLGVDTASALGVSREMLIQNPNEKNLEYLEYHRNYVFNA